MFFLIICVFFSALLIVCFSIKKIIYVANKCHLFDNPNEIRKVHLDNIPNLGGVAMYITIIACAAIFASYYPIPKINYIFVASIIIFTLGLTDDLVGVDPKKKFFAQFIASLTTTVIANIRFTSFYGIFGIGEIPYGLSIILTVLFIIFLINAFNLIDGINCLAGGVALLANIVFAICFWQMHQLGFMLLAVTICGVLIGFLFYNKTPAKIFMGDTGSLSLGFVMAIFSINFIESNYAISLVHKSVFSSAAVIILGLLIIPIFDALRVFTLRILNGKSPFDADRNHIHHRLLDLNFTHLQATATLLVINILFIIIVFFFNNLGNEKLLCIIIFITLLLNGSSWLLLNKKNNKSNNYDIVSETLVAE